MDTHTVSLHAVRLSKVITPQLSVSVPRLERRAPINRTSNLGDLLRLSFDAGGAHEPVYRQTLGLAPNGGALLYTSYDEDIRVHQPPVIRQLKVNDADPNSPELEAICFPVGGGTPFAFAFLIALGPGHNRLILANGIHRAVAAVMSGLDWMPLAVCELSPLELPDPFVDCPKAMLLDPTFNPPMIQDFSNESVVIPLEYHRVLRTVRFNWNTEIYSVPVR